MFFPVKRPWTEQPPPGTPIDLANPLTDGLVAAWVFDSEGSLRDALGKHHSTITGGTPALIGTPQGVAVRLDGISDDFSIPDHADLNFNEQDMTVVLGITPRVAGSSGEVFEKQTGSNNIWQLRQVAGAWQFFVKQTGSFFEAISSAFTLGQYYNVACRANPETANDVSILVDGVLDDTTAFGVDGDWSNTAPLLIAAGNLGNNQCDLLYMWLFRKYKTDQEIQRFHENPWRIFEPRRTWALIGGGPQTVVLGLATETDSALPLGKLKEKAIGLATETDSALPLGKLKEQLLGLALETDLALPLGKLKEKLLGLVLETDSALPITPAGAKIIAVGLALETDSALPLSKLKEKLLGLALETDSALPLSKLKEKLLGLALETDSALPLTFVGDRTVVIGLAIELDTALSMTTLGGAAIAGMADPTIMRGPRRRFYARQWNQFAETFDAFLRRQESLVRKTMLEAQPLEKVVQLVVEAPEFQTDLEELVDVIRDRNEALALQPAEMLEVLQDDVEELIRVIQEEDDILAIVALVAASGQLLH